jgi:hypothetical protein
MFGWVERGSEVSAEVVSSQLDLFLVVLAAGVAVGEQFVVLQGSDRGSIEDECPNDQNQYRVPCSTSLAKSFALEVTGARIQEH